MLGLLLCVRAVPRRHRLVKEKQEGDGMKIDTNKYNTINETSYRYIDELYQSYVTLLKRKQSLVLQKHHLFSEVDSLENETLHVKLCLMQLLESKNNARHTFNDICLRLGQTTPDVVIYNPAEVPEEFTVVNRAVDTDEIKRRLLQGESVPGAKLCTNKTLEIIAQDEMVNTLGEPHD
jgi:hypothetical protein